MMILEAIPANAIDRAEAMCFDQPQPVCPVDHHFAPGVYCREITMHAGDFIIGHKHRTTHLNVVLTGRASVLIDGVISEIKAPMIFVSAAGVRKALLIHETMKFATIHPTDETDLAKLETICIEKSPAWLAHQDELKALQEHAAKGQIA